VLTPIIGSLFGKPDFSAMAYDHVMIGNFLNAVIAFALVAASVYFFIVMPANALMARFKGPAPEVPPATKPCPQCLSDIPVAAKRCSHCTQPV
jgi:large conductance mechanosensitive channel